MSTNFTFTLENNQNQASVFIDHPTTLSLSITYSGDSPFSLTPAQPTFPPSQGTTILLEIIQVMSPSEIEAMTLQEKTGWEGKVVKSEGSAFFLITPTRSGSLNNGDSLQFNLEHAQASGDAVTGQVRLAIYDGRTITSQILQPFNAVGHSNEPLINLKTKLEPNDSYTGLPTEPIFYSDVYTVPSDASFQPGYPVTSPLLISLAQQGGGTTQKQAETPQINISMVTTQSEDDPGYGALTSLELAKQVMIRVSDSSNDNWEGGGLPQSSHQLPQWQLTAKKQSVFSDGEAIVTFEIHNLVSNLAPGVTRLNIQVFNVPGFADTIATVLLDKIEPTPKVSDLVFLPTKPIAHGSVQLTWNVKFYNQSDMSVSPTANIEKKLMKKVNAYDPNLWEFEEVLTLPKLKTYVVTVMIEGQERHQSQAIISAQQPYVAGCTDSGVVHILGPSFTPLKFPTQKNSFLPVRGWAGDSLANLYLSLQPNSGLPQVIQFGWDGFTTVSEGTQSFNAGGISGRPDHAVWTNYNPVYSEEGNNTHLHTFDKGSLGIVSSQFPYTNYRMKSLSFDPETSALIGVCDQGEGSESVLAAYGNFNPFGNDEWIIFPQTTDDGWNGVWTGQGIFCAAGFKSRGEAGSIGQIVVSQEKDTLEQVYEFDKDGGNGIAIMGSSGDKIWAVMTSAIEGSQIVKSTVSSGATNWEECFSTPGNITALWVASDDLAVAAGSNDEYGNVVWKYDGTHWKEYQTFEDSDFSFEYLFCYNPD